MYNMNNHCRRLAICTVRLSIYICSVSFPDVSLSTSFCVDLMRAKSAEVRSMADIYITARVRTAKVVLRCSNISGARVNPVG